ncbi:MAG: Smr/MutS family protein [Bacteroidia bacterium]|nr:Smr/MutS family protein [Bacteroidia bacterium]
MNYRIGQRVRLLHHHGEGVVTRLIDKDHVEVDLGDDFPVDVRLDEIIRIDSLEQAYFAPDEAPEVQEVKQAAVMKKLGFQILEASVVAHRKGASVELLLVNPEPADLLYAFHLKLRNAWYGKAAGRLNSGEQTRLVLLSETELAEAKGLHIQLIPFVPDKTYPQPASIIELPWSKGKLNEPPRLLTLINGEGWVYSLRQQPQAADVKAIEDSEFLRVRLADQPIHRPEPEIDLHIEALVKQPDKLNPAEILQIQLNRLEKALSDALVHHYASMVLIHGVGEGKLRAAVQDRLKRATHVKTFAPADAVKYGNGATKVMFR